ncbi:retrovirus-related pol polyprotein from transposon TNT 1-94 [Tanacetum coccineum]
MTSLACFDTLCVCLEHSVVERTREIDIGSQFEDFLLRVNNYSSVSKGFQPKFYSKNLFSLLHSNSQADPNVFEDYTNKGLVVKTFDWDEEEVSDKEEVTQVKVLMALADDELTVGKSHACNGEWVDITIRKEDELLILKQAKLDAVTFQIQNTELTKLNHALQEQLKEEKKINEKWLTSSKKVSQCISEQIPHQKKKVLGGELFTESSSKMNENENLFVPASMGYDQEMVPKTKDWVERLNPDRLLQNFNTGRILVPESQAVNESLESTEILNTPESSKDSEAESLTPLPPLKNLQGASPSSEVMPLTFQPHSPKERPGLGHYTCGSTVHSTTDQNEFDHFQRGEKIQAAKAREPTKKERIHDIIFFHMFGCPVFIHNHKDHLGKFYAKADDRYFLGYSFISKAFRVFNTRRQHIEETYHVTFDESMMAISEQIPHQKKKVLGGELFTESSSKMNEKENIFVPASMGELHQAQRILLTRVFQELSLLVKLRKSYLQFLLKSKRLNKNKKLNELTKLVQMLIDEKVNSNQKTQESNSKIQKTKLSKSVNSSRMSQDSKPKDQNTGSSKSLRPKPIQTINLGGRIIGPQIMSKGIAFPTIHNVGFNDHNIEIDEYYHECGICVIYDHFTSRHNRVIQIRGGVLAESSQSNESSIGVKFDTCGSTVHPTTDHNEFNHFKRETHQGAHLVPGQWMLKDYDRCQELSAQICKATRKCLHLLHMDLFGPVSPMSINHEKYTLVIVDEYSRMVENQNDVKVKQIKTDNGTEFRNHKLESFCDEK